MCKAIRLSGATRWPGRGRAFLLLALLAGTATPPAVAQQGLDESRRRLEEVRRERERLEQERIRLQSQVHDLNAELDNLERQRQSTNRIVNEIESQIGGLNTHVDRASADLALAQDNLAEKRAVVARRLAEIYKRGTLYTFEVMVAAQSFGDLLSRYKYLFLQSRQDRALVTDVEKLTRQVERRRREILDTRSQLDSRRVEREAELTPLRPAGGGRRPPAAARPGAPPAPPSSASLRWSRTRPGSTPCWRNWNAPGGPPRRAAPRALPTPGHSPPVTSANWTGRWRGRS